LKYIYYLRNDRLFYIKNFLSSKGMKIAFFTVVDIRMRDER